MMIVTQYDKVLFICDNCDKPIKDGELMITGELDIMRNVNTLLDLVDKIVEPNYHICSFKCLDSILSEKAGEIP